jgi:hypothetical protein
MTTDEIKTLLEETLPADKINSLAQQIGVIDRQSKIRIAQLVCSLVLTSRAPAGARQADAMRSYRKVTGQHAIHRGTFYARFDVALEKLLEELLAEAMFAADEVKTLLPPAIDTVEDWLIVDSTTVKLHDALKDIYPGTGEYAALKVHKTYSIGHGNMINYHLSPAREHDAKHCRLTEDLRGCGLLVDLGYVSHHFLLDCRHFGVEFVIRLKTGWKVNVESVIQGEVAAAAFDKGPFDLAEALAGQTLRFKDGRLDLDVALTIDGKRFALRLVALEIPGKGTCAFLTSLTRDRYDAELVGSLYRLRWDIEKDNKINKSDFGLSELDGRKAESVHAMLYASLLGTIIVNRIVHQDHLELFATWKRKPRAPMHARLVALALASAHFELAMALTEPERPTAAWKGAYAVIEGSGRDPNWRRRPSVLDVLLGFTVPPGRPRKMKAGAS